ncbi:MAG: stage II sporulation protein D [Eubacteriales bacterium]|nr:stage II sporulation protein D [Eubacteriales bacterium]
MRRRQSKARFLPAFLTALPWRGAVSLGLLLSLAALIVRGCCYSKTPPPSPPQSEARVSVYDHRAEETVSMALEEYLVGVVAAEMPASFETEALKAQAVAARTYTLRRTEDACGRGGAQICTDSACCQAYRSLSALRENWGGAYEENLGKVQRAVWETAGQAAFYEGELIEALYHSSAGGQTEDAAHVFANDVPYLVSVDSPGEEVSAAFHDTVRVSRKRFAKAVNQAWSGAGLKASSLHKQVKVRSRFASGRVDKVKLGKAEATGRELRKLFELNSANFTLEITADEVVFRTTGYGHGVGMSQYGANAMAKEGADYKEILAHYYAGITIDTAY